VAVTLSSSSPYWYCTSAPNAERLPAGVDVEPDELGVELDEPDVEPDEPDDVDFGTLPLVGEPVGFGVPAGVVPAPDKRLVLSFWV